MIETITKEKIAQALKTKIGLSGVLCEEIINHIFKELYKLIEGDQKITLKNFGSFYLKSKKARPGQNLQTKETIIIPPRKVIRFLPAKALKKEINKL